MFLHFDICDGCDGFECEACGGCEGCDGCEGGCDGCRGHEGCDECDGCEGCEGIVLGPMLDHKLPGCFAFGGKSPDGISRPGEDEEWANEAEEEDGDEEANDTAELEPVYSQRTAAPPADAKERNWGDGSWGDSFSYYGLLGLGKRLIAGKDH